MFSKKQLHSVTGKRHGPTTTNCCTYGMLPGTNIEIKSRHW